MRARYLSIEGNRAVPRRVRRASREWGRKILKKRNEIKDIPSRSSCCKEHSSRRGHQEEKGRNLEGSGRSRISRRGKPGRARMGGKGFIILRGYGSRSGKKEWTCCSQQSGWTGKKDDRRGKRVGGKGKESFLWLRLKEDFSASAIMRIGTIRRKGQRDRP